MDLKNTFSSLDFQGRITGKRGYSPRVGASNTVLLSVGLPQGVSRLITAYANMTGQSRNELVIGLLEMGLVTYLKAENAFLEAICSLTSGDGFGAGRRNMGV